MPLGLWKSKWEIHREEMDRREAERRAETERREAKWSEERAESSRRHDEVMAQLKENDRNLTAMLKMVTDELIALRREVHELTDAVHAQTEAILRLIDRFDEFEGRPPGSGRMGPRSA